MTSIDTSAQQTLDSLLRKLGVQKLEDRQTEQGERKQRLGQEDFLRLMTTQLSNQDPFAPMENGEFIAQMAQFSTVTGLTELNTTVKDVAGKLSENRIATAASFIGKTVLVPGGTAFPNETGGINGAIDLPNDASSLTVAIRDPAGALVKTLNLGPNAKGLVGFEWDGRDENGNKVEADHYRVEAFANRAGKQEQISTHVYGRVDNASVPDATGNITLGVRGYGDIDINKVRKISG